MSLRIFSLHTENTYNWEVFLNFPAVSLGKLHETVFSKYRVTEISFPTKIVIDETQNSCYIKIQLFGFGFSINIF